VLRRRADPDRDRRAAPGAHGPGQGGAAGPRQRPGAAGRVRPGEHVMAARRGKSQAKRNGGGGRPAWVWLVAGVVIGAVALGAWQFKDRWNPRDGLLPQPDPNAQPEVAATDDSADDVAPPAE